MIPVIYCVSPRVMKLRLLLLLLAFPLKYHKIVMDHLEYSEDNPNCILITEYSVLWLFQREH